MHNCLRPYADAKNMCTMHFLGDFHLALGTIILIASNLHYMTKGFKDCNIHMLTLES